MEPQELRLGNLVMWEDTSKEIVSITEILKRENYYSVSFEGGCAQLDEFIPIPLNEDWLEKFGLIKKYLENPFEEGGYDLDEKGNRWYHWVQGTFNLEIQTNGEIWFEVYSHYIPVKTVHQLQNIYFSLTGEELKLK